MLDRTSNVYDRELTSISSLFRRNYVFLSAVFIGAFGFEMYVGQRPNPRRKKRSNINEIGHSTLAQTLYGTHGTKAYVLPQIIAGVLH